MLTSQRINHDPKPWIRYDGSRSARPSLYAVWDRPRECFENTPNPILEDVRATLASTPESFTCDPVEYVMTAWLDMEGEAAEAHKDWTPAHYWHALKVARKFAAVYGS